MRVTSKQMARAQANGGKFIASERKELHRTVEYLKIQYPNVLFYFDYGADALLTGRQAKERKDLSCVRGFPELHIIEPRHSYAGLYIDMKREDVSIYNSKGLFKTDHLKEQNEVMVKLRARNYYCCFCKGFDAAKIIIDGWFNIYALPQFPRVKLPS